MKVPESNIFLGVLMLLAVPGLSNAGGFDYRAGTPVWDNPSETFNAPPGAWRYSLVGGNRHRFQYGVTFIDKSYAPAYTGNKALRFEVRGNRQNGRTWDQSTNRWLSTRPNDCSWEVDDNGIGMIGDMTPYSDCRENKARAEIYRGGCWNGQCDVNPGRSTSKWYSWNIYIPEGITPADRWLPTIGQWHHQHCNNTVHLRWAPGNRINVENFAVAPGTAGLPDHNGTDDGWHPGVRYGGAHVTAGNWHNIRLHVNWSSKSDGLVIFWLDGKKVVSKKGPTMYPDSFGCGGLYSKFGIYRSAVTSGNTLIMYYDDLREGGSLQSMLSARDAFYDLTRENSVADQNPGSGSVVTFADYVRGNGDLLAAFNINPTGLSMQEWGRRHWNDWGRHETRTVVPSASALSTPPVAEKIKLSDLASEERASRFMIGPDILALNNTIVTNNRIFSFEDYQIVNTKTDAGIILGFKETDGGFQPVNNVVGYRMDNTTVLFTVDDTLLGYDFDGLMSVKGAKTSYFNLRHTTKVTDTNWNLDGTISYARATGHGHGNSFIVTVDTVHAVGFDARATYDWNENNSTLFSITQPLRIESGSLNVMGMRSAAKADLTPDGRELSFGVQHEHKFTDYQSLVSSFSYVNDLSHVDGLDHASVMFTYRSTF